MKTKTGYVAFLGRPNAGKSTLMNACIGTKLAIVSNKPQTTRNKILGIYTKDETQILFLDTPGIHNAEKLPSINHLMNTTAWSVLRDCDVVCYLVDVTRGLSEEDIIWLSEILKKFNKKLILLATKSDKIKKEIVHEKLSEINNGFDNLILNLDKEQINCVDFEKQFLPISSKVPDNVNFLRNLISHYLTPGPWLYAEDDITDKPQKFICAEMIREQIFRQLGEELPYKIAVTVDLFQKKEKFFDIHATIIVERSTQKAIVIGAGGKQIKNIGMLARQELERHLGQKVFLELFVKVQNGWTDNLKMISDFALLSKLPSDSLSQ